jgi:hypothetical protein
MIAVVHGGMKKHNFGALFRSGSNAKQNARWNEPSGILLWRRPIDSHVPTCSPATLAGLTIYLAVPNRSVLLRHAAFRRAVLPPSPRLRRDRRVGLAPKTKNPTGKPAGFLLWRRPTLARPIAVLPSGLQRFTSVFGMGTGGATALLSPESDAGLAGRRFRG